MGGNAKIDAVLRVMCTCAALLSFAAVSLPAQTASGTPSRKPAPAGRRHAARTAPKIQEPPAPPTAIASMTPEQLPAVAPRVSFHNGVLTVDAENSTLAAVLNAIRRQTGAQIDVPPTGANQRIAAHLSGTPREVIASLLNGSELGYAIVAAPDNPERVQQVILMTQSRGTGQVPANSGPGMNPAPGMNAAPPVGQPPVEPEPDLAPADEGPTPEQMNERFPQQGNQQEPPPGQPPVNGMSPNGMPPNTPQSPEQQQQQMQNNGAQGKTPEQLLQELQRMRNRRYSAQQ